MASELPGALLSALAQRLGPRGLVTDATALAPHLTEWRGLYHGRAAALLAPASTAEAAAAISLCAEAGIAMVPQGGNTGLVGGAIPRSRPQRPQVILSAARLNRIRELDSVNDTITAEAGCVLATVQAAAADAGRLFPLSLAAEGSCQLGGNIATNAGGINVLRYGSMREQVLGLEVVLPDGQVFNGLRALRKDNTGYDLRHLFIGAEGTLGFITRATMKLTRPPRNLTVLVLGLTHFRHIMDVLQLFSANIDLTAFEFFSHKALRHVLARGEVPAPFEGEAPFYALLECEATTEDVLNDAMSLFEKAVEEGWVLDGVISQSETQARNLWRLREDISETIARHTPYKNDISVVPSRVPAFLEEIDEVVSRHYPDFEIVWFGHIGDGNLHLNILKPADLPREEFFRRCEQVNTWVFEIVARHNGSVSAEHGVGLLKKDYIGYSRSAEEIEYMKAIKRVFDPNGIMNPGKLIDL